jgi:putative glutamine amidotransferase
MSDNPLVLSSHHQAIRELGENLYTIATSMDGKIPEIIRHVTFENVLGVQFHPEYAALYLKGKFFLERPGSSPDLNLGTFLTNHPPSMAFHIQLWKWFSQALKASRHSQ